MGTIADFEVVNHGIENSQYFQGCGCAFTQFSHVATGIGDDFAGAVSDALDCISQEHKGDFEQLEALILADSPAVKESVSDLYPEQEDCEMYYHVSIRYNVNG